MKREIWWLEDDLFFVRRIMEPIRDRGWIVTTFETASELLEELGRLSDCALVVVDLLVPGGEGRPDERYAGVSVIKELAKQRNCPPILVFSVVGRAEVLQDIEKYTKHILTKPVRLDVFIDTVTALLEDEPAIA